MTARRAKATDIKSGTKNWSKTGDHPADLVSLRTNSDHAGDPALDIDAGNDCQGACLSPQQARSLADFLDRWATRHGA